MGRVAAIQRSSTDSVEQNLAALEHLVKNAVNQGAELVVLPENVAFIGKKDADKLAIAEVPYHGPIQAKLSSLAKEHNIWLVGGTIPIKADDNHVFASSWVWDNRGQAVARYDKIHLFDVFVPPLERYQESDTTRAGKDIISLDSPVGKLGLTVCYDVRFPELYRSLMGQEVEIMTIVSAFTAITGEAHWQTLVRARAIENLCYVIAPNQTGTHANGRASFGHSMIIDPWGKVLASLKAEEGVIIADIDLNYLQETRTRFPAIKHRKIF
jgi:nitrilase